MSLRPIDLQRAKAWLAELDALVQAHPELQEPDAQARLTAWLAQEQRPMTSARTKRQPKGDEKSRARVQRLRQRRKQAGMKAYELWLPPKTAALLAQLKQPGEALHDTIGRALAALQAHETQGPPPIPGGTLGSDERRAALVQRMHTMQADGLSLQAIATQFNAEGVLTLTGKGRWQKGTISNLLAQG